MVDFTYTTSTGTFCHPQKVTFTQNCSPVPPAFIWDFGNGQSNTHATDTALYLAPGTYTVKLIGLYTDSAIVKTKTITINPTPVVLIGADHSSLCTPGIINFTASGGIASGEWNYGDGSPTEILSGNTAAHNYTDYGQYTVTLIGSTAAGCKDTATMLVEVKKFVIAGDIGPKEGCIPFTPLLIVNAALPPGDAVQSYVWDFDDGSPPFTSTNNSTTHPYNITTPIHAHVVITSVNGCVNQFDFQQVAYGTVPTDLHAGTVSGLDSFCGNELVHLKAKAIDATGYTWDFGPGGNTYIEDTLLDWKFNDTGWYHATVIPKFHGCEGDPVHFDIYIKGVVGKFKMANTCANKNSFILSNTSSGYVSHYYWTFQDDPSILDSVHFNIAHTFPVTGSYLVTLRVKDTTTGCADTVRRVISLAVPSFTVDKTTVCKDSLIRFSVMNSYPPGYVLYNFHVAGTLISDNADSVANVYPPSHGTYANYVVIDHQDPLICNDTLHLPGTINVAGPVVSFTASPHTVCMNVPTVLTNSSHPYFPADQINTWHWDFWDGTVFPSKDPPPHLFPFPGEYIVTLVATDINSCGGTDTVHVLVQPVPEITVYPRSDTICLNRDTAVLSAYSIYPFVWSPDVNINCNNCDTIKAYPAVTTMYYATATNAGGCSSKDSSFLRVYAPFHAAVTPLNINVCPKVSVPLSVATPGVIRWSPPQFLSDTTIANPVALPEEAVIYRVIVTDSAGCYADTAYVNLGIYPLPTVDAGPDKVLVYGNNFTISPAYSANVQTYLWTPAGTLDCTTCGQPKGTASQTIKHTIEVTSDKGCKASDDIRIVVLCDKAGLYLPSAFTPFNGGTNNYFYPIAHGYKNIKTFIIYNRMGNKIFERKDFAPNISTLGWNGMIKGDNTHSTQAFVWYVEAECEQGETVSSKGTVLLIR